MVSMASWTIKYTPGAKPGVKRKLQTTPTEAEKKLKLTEYEQSKRPPRSFNEKWKEGREWLKFDPEKNIMTCTYCISYSSSSILKSSKCTNNLKNKMLFVSGCSNFRYSTITDQEKSVVHQETTKMYLAAKNPTATSAHKSLISMNEHKRKQLELKFRNIHAVIKHNRPISDFMWLNQLDIAKGLDHGDTYNNHMAGTNFLMNIALIEKEKCADFVKQSTFFSLTMDGSTDDSVTEQETIFVRTCISGKVSSRLMCIGEPESTASKDLHTFVIDKLKDNLIFDQMYKLVGFASDGASNMTGSKNGLIALLKNDYPGILGIHCLGHRLELAFRLLLKKTVRMKSL